MDNEKINTLSLVILSMFIGLCFIVVLLCFSGKGTDDKPHKIDKPFVVTVKKVVEGEKYSYVIDSADKVYKTKDRDNVEVGGTYLITEMKGKYFVFKERIRWGGEYYGSSLWM